MGNVFLAEQLALGNRQVALKVLLRKLLDDPEFLSRFRDEATSTARIHHANVVVIYESGQSDDGTPYIAMEYLEGETLRELLKARGTLPLSETVGIVQQVARGLYAAHKLDIIHRDLKPDNIFLTYTDERELVSKVVDFGIAKLAESTTQTLTGVMLGTPAYMSPEQAAGMRSDKFDARSDVYSLGIVTYEMLAGRVPFESDTPLGYLRKHMLEEPPPLRAVRLDLLLPPRIEKVIMKALRKDRDLRYSSTVEFALELVEAAQQQAPVPEMARGGSALASSPSKAGISVQTPPPLQVESPVRKKRAIDETKRRGDRVQVAIPIRVRGLSTLSKFFDEETETNWVTKHMLTTRLRNLVDLESDVHVTSLENNIEGIFRVVWVNTSVQNEFHDVGLELVQAEGNLWEIEFPATQQDEKEAKVWLECQRCHRKVLSPVPEAEDEYLCEGFLLARPCVRCKASTPWALTGDPKSASGPGAAAKAPQKEILKEQRGKGRVSIKMKIKVTREKYDVDLEDIGETVNVSTSGVLFVSSQNYNVGDLVEVILPYKLGEVGIPTSARVVRQDRGAGTSSNLVALHFYKRIKE